jgi:hypothetical protein
MGDRESGFGFFIAGLWITLHVFGYAVMYGKCNVKDVEPFVDCISSWHGLAVHFMYMVFQKNVLPIQCNRCSVQCSRQWAKKSLTPIAWKGEIMTANG